MLCPVRGKEHLVFMTCAGTRCHCATATTACKLPALDGVRSCIVRSGWQTWQQYDRDSAVGMGPGGWLAVPWPQVYTLSYMQQQMSFICTLAFHKGTAWAVQHCSVHNRAAMRAIMRCSFTRHQHDARTHPPFALGHSHCILVFPIVCICNLDMEYQLARTPSG